MDENEELRQRKPKQMKKRDGEVQECSSKSSSLESYLRLKFNQLSPRIQSFIVRAVITFILLVLLPVLVFGDFISTFVIICIITLQCYREYIRVGCVDMRADNVPLIRSFAYYIFFISQYSFLAEFPITYLQNVIPEDVYDFLTSYGPFINFCTHMLSVVVFVLTLKKHYYKRQFTMFGWFLIGSSFLGCSARCLFKNVQKGLIWAYLPMSLIVLNDISAYICGVCFGKTPLIRISPKKTWEGFIGSGIITLIGSLIITKLLTTFEYFYCPYNFSYGSHKLSITCKVPYFMEPQTYQLPVFLTIILPERVSSIQYYPIYFHGLVIATFCSLLAPFGGFLASGFKRAYNIKDFGQTFPGHGGMLDRMDCQFLITIFVHFYASTFLKVDENISLYRKIVNLPTEDIVQLFNMLKTHLETIGAVNI